MPRAGNRNRVLGDRLWDDAGLLWTTERSEWLTARQVRQMLDRDQRVVVHGFGVPMRWLDAAAVRRWWSHAQHHFEAPGEHGAEPDDDMLTWGAQLWRRADARLLGFQHFC